MAHLVPRAKIPAYCGLSRSACRSRLVEIGWSVSCCQPSRARILSRQLAQIGAQIPAARRKIGSRAAQAYSIFVFLEQLFPRYLLIRDLYKRKQEIDDRVFEQGRPQSRNRSGIVAVI